MFTRWLMNVAEFVFDGNGFKIIGTGFALDEREQRPNVAQLALVTCTSKIPFQIRNPNLEINDVLDLKSVLHKNNNFQIEIQQDSTIDVFIRNGQLQVPLIRVFERKVEGILNERMKNLSLTVKHAERPAMNVPPKDIPDNIWSENKDEILTDRPAAL